MSHGQYIDHRGGFRMPSARTAALRSTPPADANRPQSAQRMAPTQKRRQAVERRRASDREFLQINRQRLADQRARAEQLDAGWMADGRAARIAHGQRVAAGAAGDIAAHRASPLGQQAHRTVGVRSSRRGDFFGLSL